MDNGGQVIKEAADVHYMLGLVSSLCSNQLLTQTMTAMSLSLDLAEDLGLLLVGLEAAVTHLGGRVDEFEFDLLQSCPRGLREQRPPERDAPFFRSWHRPLQSPIADLST